MAAFESVDITSEAFRLRLANLLVATRTRNGQGVGAMAKQSGGRFHRRDLKAFEAGERPLDETTIDELATLYAADLGAILPLRLPVVISANRISAGGVHEEYDPADHDALLAAYLTLVRTLRRQRRTPVVDLRRDDIEVLSGFLQQPKETVVHRLATLMHATQTKRTAMIGVLATGAAVVGLVGTVAAVGISDTSPPADPTETTSVVVDTTAPSTTSVETTIVETTVVETTAVTTTVVDTTIPETTVVTVPPTQPPVTAPVTQPPVTVPAPTTTQPKIDVDLTTTTVLQGTDLPPIVPQG
ncbi:MAG: hypothetical protein ACOYMR_10780 [Ilumatobacteraceae bacterium]